MPIGNAVQRGGTVYVYDKKGRQITTLPAGTGPKDGLIPGLTSADRLPTRVGRWT